MLDAIDKAFIDLGLTPKRSYWGQSQSIVEGKKIACSGYTFCYHWNPDSGWLTIYDFQTIERSNTLNLSCRKLTALLEKIVDRVPTVRAIAGAIIDSDTPAVQALRIKMAEYWINQGATWESVDGVDHLVKHFPMREGNATPK